MRTQFQFQQSTIEGNEDDNPWTIAKFQFQQVRLKAVFSRAYPHTRPRFQFPAGAVEGCFQALVFDCRQVSIPAGTIEGSGVRC